MNGQSGKRTWWFVVHGEESTPRKLDSKWECLQTQASWTLHPCTKPAPEGVSAAPSPNSSELEAVTTDDAVSTALDETTPPLAATFMQQTKM